jgi:hypothetical protein
MRTLPEIEAAADALPANEKAELFLFLVTRLRAAVQESVPPREFSAEQLQRWMADDEAGYRRFLSGL